MFKKIVSFFGFSFLFKKEPVAVEKRENKEETMVSDKDGVWYKYVFPHPLGDKLVSIFMSSCKIRNYRTILRTKDDITHCPDCGTELKSKVAGFSIWAIEMAGGFGHVERRPVMWCPKCDAEPDERQVMRLPMKAAMALH